ncbi:MAG TPA: hypothetical protein GXX73_01125 [Clostridium sp.]|nr:hypothetical protein [Clostridium sp.]
MDQHKLRLTHDEITLLKSVIEWVEKKSTNESNRILLGSIKDKINQKLQYNDDFSYLNGLSEQAKQFFFEFMDKYGINLYHSISSVLHQKKYRFFDEYFEYYYQKYKDKRPLLQDKINELQEMINHVSRRIGVTFDEKQ